MLLERLRQGLEAAAILLFVMNSPAMDRTVINEDAIEASIVLLRHHLAKNLLPSLNQIGHITSADHDQESSAAALTSTAKKRRRRRGSSLGASSSSSSSELGVIRDMKKVYQHLYATVGLTVPGGSDLSGNASRADLI